MTFLGTQNIDQEFAAWLATDFREYRKQSPLTTRSIVTSDDHPYITEYTAHEYDSVIIDNTSFQLSQEIVLFPNKKIAVLMYAKKELSAWIIQSPSFYQSLKSFFDVIWDAYKQ